MCEFCTIFDKCKEFPSIHNFNPHKFQFCYLEEFNLYKYTKEWTNLKVPNLKKKQFLRILKIFDKLEESQSVRIVNMSLYPQVKIFDNLESCKIESIEISQKFEKLEGFQGFKMPKHPKSAE